MPKDTDYSARHKNLVYLPGPSSDTYTPLKNFTIEYIIDTLALTRHKEWEDVYARLLSRFFRENIVLRAAKEASAAGHLIDTKVFALYNELVQNLKEVQVEDALTVVIIELEGKEGEKFDMEKKIREDNAKLQALFDKEGAEEKLTDLLVHLLRLISASERVAYDPSGFRFSVLYRLTGDDDSDWDKIWPPSDEERLPFKPHFWGAPEQTLAIGWTCLKSEHWWWFALDKKNENYQLLIEPQAKDKSLLQQLSEVQSHCYINSLGSNAESARFMLINLTRNWTGSRKLGKCEKKNYWRFLGHTAYKNKYDQWEKDFPLQELA